ncbi:hypothetical protein [Tuwongella immobilis]|uniref:Uncharacterized protein n=1 Tax=Tuwongella immobilis TaxID=692036 RepID=A0A6C2YUN9_9BACT|nr:hypothetical protein [Tuwongella immobilis]VIP05330.1 Uncharacterized protein OS=Mesorhizobium sp. LNJC405B00 GN=X755_06955 PE=4 SV=1 [Tuwongella immobilis]VTS08016.1 Uncharacterized protein OS=Mesorhizobium sp. LNJC405B00 GN=X755_06955 PE=4 SV=1 [Tuwongella immobilis]
MSTGASDLVRSIQQSWPAWLPPVIQSGDTVTPTHILAPEVSALLSGRAASLPYFLHNQSVAWMTLAPDTDSILASLTDLRAWIVPSIGWEEEGQGTVVTTASGALGASILSLSPAGYIRWRSRADTETIIEIAGRLARARGLAESVPLHVQAPVPALIELRQQLATSLAANDRVAAEDTLATINRLQLDTAQNASFTRLRVLEHFGDSRLVVELPELDQLLRVRLPQNTRIAIAKAFYRHFVEPKESQGSLTSARDEFVTQVLPKIGSLLDALRPEVGVEVRRLLAYRLATGEGSLSREALSGYIDDPVVAALLSPVQQQPAPVPLSDEDQFFAAWQTLDWAEVQRLGMLLLPTRPDIVPVLARSLDRLPNAPLRDALTGIQTPAKQSTPAINSPQTWAEWLTAIPTGELSHLEQLLSARVTAGMKAVTSAEGREIADKLTDLLVGQTSHLDSGRRTVLLTGLAELAGLCVGVKDFPAAGLIDLYRVIANCWSVWKRGSAFPPDGQILLELADGLLQLSVEEEKWLSDEISRWWETRPTRALLPFMISAVEIFHRLAGTGTAERFWIDVGTFAKSKEAKLTQGERLLWRKVGADIGWDEGTLDEYMPLPSPAEGVVIDPLKAAGLKKIAIVSMREEQAKRAADQLKDRTGATVVLVSDTTSGPETDLAATADVIAYVWSATTHAVFRAFDKVDRKKIAYVRGTGAASIVLAVERWSLERGD